MAMTDLQTEYAGRKGRLLGLATKTGLLTVLTLGIYRFWMKTRLRRFYWSAIRPGGQPLEYIGLPMEKLLGFLIAVVFLSFYIGIVNLLLMFLSFSLLQNNFAAYAISLIGVIPFYFYARYRARRYILARTRWRGVRFGVEPGAWGYTWRAMIHWLVTIFTVGIFWPRMTFWLEKYLTDRTYFGTQKLHQGGHWQMLYRPFLPFLFGLIMSAIAAVLIFLGNEDVGAGIGFLSVIIVFYGLAYYNVHSFRKLTNAKTAGAIGFRSHVRARRVIWIYLFGNGIVVTLLILLFAIFGVLIGAILVAGGLDLGSEVDIVEIGKSAPAWLTVIVGAMLYFAAFLAWSVLRQVFVTLPLARHYAETLELFGASNLAKVGQRDRDEFAEAEGFAEALDVGAAI